MAKRKQPSERLIKALIKALPKWFTVMVLCLGVLFGVLIEGGFITLEQVQQALGYKVFDSGSSSVPESSRSFSVNIIDVGQGDCILIKAADKSILIDSGEREYAPDAANFIRKSGIARLDYVIATHPHSDHIGGMGDIIEEFGADKIIVPRLPDDMTPSTSCYERFLTAVKNSGSRLTAAKAGNVYSICEINGTAVTMTILSPDEGAAFADLNDYSVCVRIDYGKVSWLFTGDLSEEGEEALLKSGQDIDVTAYKVAHHGSSSSSGAAFLNAVTPRLCVISCGSGNSYGHPHDAVMKRLKMHTESIYRTDISSTVAVYSDGEKLYVSLPQRKDDTE